MTKDIRRLTTLLGLILLLYHFRRTTPVPIARAVGSYLVMTLSVCVGAIALIMVLGLATQAHFGFKRYVRTAWPSPSLLPYSEPQSEGHYSPTWTLWSYGLFYVPSVACPFLSPPAVATILYVAFQLFNAHAYLSPRFRGMSTVQLLAFVALGLTPFGFHFYLSCNIAFENNLASVVCGSVILSAAAFVFESWSRVK